MRRKICVFYILVMLLIASFSTLSATTTNIMKSNESNEKIIDFNQKEFDEILPYEDDFHLQLKEMTGQNFNKPILDIEESNNDPEISTTNLATHKLTLEPEWGYDNRQHKEGWGIYDCWQEGIKQNGEYHKTTCHAWAGPGAGWTSISVSLMHWGSFYPPKDTAYTFKYYMNMKGKIKLSSMSGLLGSSAARGGARFYIYLWDGETHFIQKSYTFRDHYSIGGVGNGQYPYDKDYTYSNSANLDKGEQYIYGANGVPWIVCDGFVEAPGLADHWVDWSGLKKLEISWSNSAPNAPELDRPSNGADHISKSPTLIWDCDDPDGKYDSLKYDIYLGTSSSPSLVKSGHTDRHYEVSNLKSNQKYYWKIKAKDSKGSTKTSPVWSFTTTGGCCFPAGTKITMADGCYKNIEDVKVGDKVLSFDFSKERFSTWRVKMLGSPVHPIIKINDGAVQATVDHPFYIKKANGDIGWAAYNAQRAKEFTQIKQDIFSMEIGDFLYTSEGTWIEITDIEYDDEPVQTYNLLSFTGTKTYFANDFLVYEEHPTGCIVEWFFDILKQRFLLFR